MLLERFINFIAAEKLFLPRDKLLLAVSGGVDSVVMSTLCRKAGFDFVIAHCNFQLRGEESLRDEDFVRNMAEKLGVEVLVKQFDTAGFAREHKLSIQVAARQLRYSWFYDLLEAGKPVDNPTISSIDAPATPKAPKFILTAHHLDDSIETMMMNFFKGTGIAGMRGILPRNGPLIRPLLFAGKAELLQFAESHALQFVEDSSNASDKYTRNYLRHTLMPAVQKIYPQAKGNLSKNLQRFREVELLYRQSIDEHKKKLLETKGSEVHIPVLKLKKTIPLETVLYEIISPYGFSPNQVKEVMDLLNSSSGKFVQSASYRIIKNRNWLIISPVQTGLFQHLVISEGEHTIHFGNSRLEIKEMPVSACTITPAADTAQLDAATIAFPLLLRKAKQGDYFYPLGMQKKKKLNRFLSDLKLSVTEKENIWVLEMDKKIIWIPGKRIDDRFKLTPHTTRVLQIRYVTSGSI